MYIIHVYYLLLLIINYYLILQEDVCTLYSATYIYLLSNIVGSTRSTTFTITLLNYVQTKQIK